MRDPSSPSPSSQPHRSSNRVLLLVVCACVVLNIAFFVNSFKKSNDGDAFSTHNDEFKMLLESGGEVQRMLAGLLKQDQQTRKELMGLKDQVESLKEALASEKMTSRNAKSSSQQELAPSSTASKRRKSSSKELVKHHEMFQKYGTWSGIVPGGCDPGHESLFLGVITSCEPLMGWASFQCKSNKNGVSIDEAPYPKLGDHTFEWLDLIYALESSPNDDGIFTMLELGAGWGKWIVDGVALAKRASKTKIVAIGVEAQEQHCEWARDHILRNNATAETKLICAAVGANDGFMEFPEPNEGDTGERYGLGIQHVLDGKFSKDKVRRVETKGFCTVVNQVEFGDVERPLDFVSLDVQSFEHAILAPSRETVDCLDARVRVLHISLHRVEENDARQLTNTMVGMLGWDIVRYFPLVSDNLVSEFGKVSFNDGVLTFLNPRFGAGPESLFNDKNIHRGPYTLHRGPKMHESVAADWSKGDYITDVKKKSIPRPERGA